MDRCPGDRIEFLCCGAVRIEAILPAFALGERAVASRLINCDGNAMNIFVKSRTSGVGRAFGQPAARHASIAAREVHNTASRISDVALLACLILAVTVAVSAGDRFNSAKLSQMDEEIERAIAEHTLPGGVW